MLDLQTACILSKSTSTGCGRPGRGPMATARTAGVGRAAGMSPEDDLIGTVGQTLWIQRLLRAVKSTVHHPPIIRKTRDACFEVMAARLARPRQAIRFTRAVLDLLATVDSVDNR